MPFKKTAKQIEELNINESALLPSSEDISLNRCNSENNIEVELGDDWELMGTFAIEYIQNNKENIYSSVCDLETYKINYYRRLQECLDEIPDAGEQYFIFHELNDVTRNFDFPFVGVKTKTKIFHSSMRKEEFLLEKMEAVGFEYFLDTTDENGLPIPSYYQKYNYRRSKNFKPNNLILPMKLKINKKELAELFKALYESDVIYGSQIDGWVHFCKLFGRDDKYLSQTLYEKKTDTNKKSDTPFLDRLIKRLLASIRK